MGHAGAILIDPVTAVNLVQIQRGDGAAVGY